MSSSVLPVEATQDAVNGIQPVAPNEDLSPPPTLITESEPSVVIAEQEVMLGSAAAVAPRSTTLTRRMIGALRVVGASFRPPPRPHYARRAAYIESACMAREMHRL
jgi:hypothetical protein